MKSKVFLLLTTLVFIAGFGSCDTTPRTDCENRSAYDSNPRWTCKKVSSFNGGCVPSTGFTDNWDCLEVDVSGKFCESTTPFYVTLYLTTNDVTFDCNNQTIDHHFDPAAGIGPQNAIRSLYESSVSNVEVKNCKIQNVGKHAIDLMRFFRGDEIRGPMKGHENFSFDNLQIKNIPMIAIYIGQNSHAISITNSSIEDAAMGMYIDSGTYDSLVSNVSITGSFEREAIAVDSAHDNIIENSHFSNNGASAIRLYKNCGERNGRNCPYSRPSGANNNILRGNTFDRDGVDVASRQFHHYNNGACEDVAGNAGFFEDVCENNVLEDNIFRNTSLDVQDGPVFIRRNTFENSTLSLGLRRRIGHDSVRIGGEFIDNIFSTSGAFSEESRSSNFSDLLIQNNVNFDGDCLSFNHCSSP